MKPTAPGSSFSYICLRSTFPLHFYSDLLNQKYKNTLLHFILFAIYLSNLLQLYIIVVPISSAVARKGLTTPLTCRVASICYLCAGNVYIVFLGSYWFDNLGLITEGNTYLRYATSSLPLWGNTDVASGRIMPLSLLIVKIFALC